MKNAAQQIQDFVSFVQGLQNDPEIAPLIDAAKIVLAPRFTIALDAAILHYLTHGDYTLIARIIGLLSVAKQQTAVLSYVWERTNLSHSWDTQGVKFAKVDRLQGGTQKKRSLSEHLKIAGKREPKTAVPSTGTAKEAPKKSPAKKRKYIDALDSRSRLPGSFEGGRSR
jgi:hypothetical protein